MCIIYSEGMEVLLKLSEIAPKTFRLPIRVLSGWSVSEGVAFHGRKGGDGVACTEIADGRVIPEVVAGKELPCGQSGARFFAERNAGGFGHLANILH